MNGGRNDAPDVPSKADGDFGPVDVSALREIQDVFAEKESLVTSTQLDNPLNPQTLHVELSDGIGDATSARFDIRVNMADDYAFHYTDNSDNDIRFDSHPRSDDIADEHVHLPEKPSEPVDSCISATEVKLVTRVVLKLWRDAYERGTLDGINEPQNPP